MVLLLVFFSKNQRLMTNNKKPIQSELTGTNLRPRPGKTRLPIPTTL